MPSLPSSMYFLAAMLYGALRFWIPHCTMRLYFRAALTICWPSQQLWVGGFSTYTSLPAWQAQTVDRACQWSGVAEMMASTVLSSSASRKSGTTRGTLPCFWPMYLASSLALRVADSFGSHA